MKETPVTVVGTVASETRARRVGPEGKLVVNFRVVSTERRFDKATESWTDGDSLFLSVSCWRSLAENAASLVKGDPVIVTGRLRTREWTTDQGERKSKVELEASAIGPDLARCNATVRRPRRDEEPASTPNEPVGDQVPHEPPPDEVILADGLRPPEEGSLSELADAARPLVPALA